MLTNRQTLYRTKRGQLLRKTREHYLRNDIDCGILGCTLCKPFAHSSVKLDPPLPVFVPDTNAVLDGIDFFESEYVKNIIFLQTVLQETRYRSSSIYDRVRSITQNPDKRAIVFSNEFHQDVYIERSMNESVNDRNDRAIRTAVLWYMGHGSNLNFFMITKDQQNSIFSLEKNISVLTRIS